MTKKKEDGGDEKIGMDSIRPNVNICYKEKHNYVDQSVQTSMSSYVLKGTG